MALSAYCSSLMRWCWHSSNSLSTYLLAQDLQRANGCGVPVFETQLFEDAGDVNFHGILGAPEYRADIGIGLSLRYPKQHFGFPRGEAKRFERFGRIEIGLEFNLGHRGLLLLAVAIQASVDSAQHL